eukprot:scaffold4412_cov71-Phaeocystis_antarctica.AAC.13
MHMHMRQNSVYESPSSSSHLLKNTEGVRDCPNAQRATATTDSRAEVKLDPCTQLFEAGS